ncbi:EpsG family protein [Lactobacillus reuteri]|uniref:EpsG family protein n=1 Tax=Limosilactobacillus reuteri TaxID=1598 RepID=UPI00146E3EAD|nr:EpsG family protein [Limosilactobacillus reuteri]NMV53469.1 EpsG family protein [Limosilactobacillus reuteri]NMV57908.1 EpsG family protein [Limosilactobacillus reuteri]
MFVYLTIFILEIITIPIYIYKKSIYLIINVIPLWIVMAYRSWNVGIDTPNYKVFFYQGGMYNVGPAFINWFFPFHTRFENGFVLLNHIVYSISPNFQLMIIVTSTITMSCFIFFLTQLKINYVVGMLTYETVTFMASCMNLMRQGIALSMCMVAFVYVIKRKPIKFILITYLAATMHVTAWLFLPIYLLKKVKLNTKSIIGVIIVTVILSTSFEFFYSKIAVVSDEAQSFAQEIANNGFNGLSNIIFSVVIIAFILYISQRVNTDTNNTLLNSSSLMLLVTLIVFIVAIKFSQLSRIAMYFMIGLFPILSFLVGGYDLKKDKVLNIVITISALIAYFILIQTLRPQWSGIVPYSFSF